MRMLRRGAAALVLIAPRRAFLAWGQHALATQRALAKLLRVFEPTRRLLGRAFNTLCDTADGMRSVRRAAAAMMHRQRPAAARAQRVEGWLREPRAVPRADAPGGGGARLPRARAGDEHMGRGDGERARAAAARG